MRGWPLAATGAIEIYLDNEEPDKSAFEPCQSRIGEPWPVAVDVARKRSLGLHSGTAALFRLSIRAASRPS
jgi:hypothetical protein